MVLTGAADRRRPIGSLSPSRRNTASEREIESAKSDFAISMQTGIQTLGENRSRIELLTGRIFHTEKRIPALRKEFERTVKIASPAFAMLVKELRDRRWWSVKERIREMGIKPTDAQIEQDAAIKIAENLQLRSADYFGSTWSHERTLEEMEENFAELVDEVEKSAALFERWPWQPPQKTGRGRKIMHLDVYTSRKSLSFLGLGLGAQAPLQAPKFEPGFLTLGHHK
jgi:hypothetical protein